MKSRLVKSLLDIFSDYCENCVIVPNFFDFPQTGSYSLEKTENNFIFSICTFAENSCVLGLEVLKQLGFNGLKLLINKNSNINRDSLKLNGIDYEETDGEFAAQIIWKDNAIYTVLSEDGKLVSKVNIKTIAELMTENSIEYLPKKNIGSVCVKVTECENKIAGELFLMKNNIPICIKQDMPYKFTAEFDEDFSKLTLVNTRTGETDLLDLNSGKVAEHIEDLLAAEMFEGLDFGGDKF